MIQDFVWTVTTILMALAAGIFAWVATAAEKAPEEYAFPVAAFYRLRPWLFAIAIVVLVAANYKALSSLPYVSQPGVGPVQRVDAVGEQWSWTITPSEVISGQPVEFHVTAKDVNHGFAIYDAGLQIVAQTQAMPNYVNVLRYTFAKPGTYQILCLEYCGLVHHDMKTEITVVQR